MNLPFCDNCKINNICEKDFDLFKCVTGSSNIPPEKFCKNKHKNLNIDISDFYKNTCINNVDNIDSLIHIFPDIKIQLDELKNENPNAYIFDENKSINKTVTLMLTDKCNLSCKYCYEKFSTNIQANTMSHKVIKKTIDMFFEQDVLNSNSSYVIWDIIGGEIFVEFNKLKFAINYIITKYIQHKICIKQKLVISLCSNGTLFTEEIKKWCIELKNKINNLSIGISLDGIQECHDMCRCNSFTTVMKNFDWWHTNFPKDTIKGTISPETLQYLFKNVKFYINELKLEQFYINPTFEGPWTNNDEQTYFDELIKCADFFIQEYPDFDVLENSNLFMNLKLHMLNHKRLSNWCGCGIYMRAVDTKGDIYPCLRAITSGYQPIGNIFNKNIVDKNKIIPFYFYTTHNETTECMNCSISSFCPTCVMQWYEDTHNIFKRSQKSCGMTKVRYFASKYFIENSKLYLEYL